jgi:hypothetical protein
MKRFGMYNDDFNNLFECYSQVNSMIVERELPSMTRVPVVTNSGERSFPGARFLKIFTQKPGLGADMTIFGKIDSIDSDDGKGGVILTARDGDKTINATISSPAKQCHIKVLSSTGEIEDDFITTVPARFDSEQKDITIINIQEL